MNLMEQEIHGRRNRAAKTFACTKDITPEIFLTHQKFFVCGFKYNNFFFYIPYRVPVLSSPWVG